MVSNPYLLRIFRRYNRKYFGGRLPEPFVCWGTLPDCDARFYPIGKAKRYRTIGGKKWHDCDKKKPIVLVDIGLRNRNETARIRMAIIHEMAHMTLPLTARHGPRFEREMLRLANASAFKGLW